MSFSAPFYRWRPHPWHGLSPGPDPPRVVHAYIEITPFDLVKYEIDKVTGYVRVDRPQRGSSQPPTLYGFVPRTYCGRRLSALSPKTQRGDGDPIDICVLSERPISRAEIILDARLIGGFQVVDDEEADDKLIGVLNNDTFWADAHDVADLPKALVERLRHYFATYKLVPGQMADIFVEQVYGREHAHAVLNAVLEDYDEEYGR